MLDRNWLLHPPVGAGLIIVILLIGAGWSARHQQRNACGGNDCAQQHQQWASREPVVVQTPPHPYPERKEWREESDLEAQWETADWARRAGIAAWVGVAITAVGVWFVRQTLNATWKAVGEAEISSNAAVQMAQAMVRLELPIVRGSSIDQLTRTESFVETEDRYGGTVSSSAPTQFSILPLINFRNYGRTAAFPTTIDIGYVVGERLQGEPNYTKSKRLGPDAVIKPEPEVAAFSGDVYFSIRLTPEEVGRLKDGPEFLWIVCAVHYEDLMRDRHEARFCWRYGPTPGTKRHHYHFEADGDQPTAFTSTT